jgi:hypothetical protein
MNKICIAILGTGNVTMYSSTSYNAYIESTKPYNIIDNIKINGQDDGIG